MANSVAVLKLACIVLMGMVVSHSPMAIAQITCNQVVSNLMPCISYVQYGGAVPATCCNGIRTLYGAAQTKVDRQNVCKCLRSALNGVSYSGQNVANAAALPGKCNVSIPYKINPNLNCDSVQ